MAPANAAVSCSGVGVGSWAGEEDDDAGGGGSSACFFGLVVWVRFGMKVSATSNQFVEEDETIH